jgi:hypothetical protein
MCAALCAFAAKPLAAQQSAPAPSDALADVLAAACRADEAKFADSLTADNGAAFRALPSDERKRLLQRFSLSDDPGRPLLSSDTSDHIVLRCEAPGGTVEFRFGEARVHENLAFIPISAVNGPTAEIGMVREGGTWKLLSLGLVLLDIKQLAAQWADADITAHEEGAAATLQTLATAINTYQRTFGKLPDALAQLGPAPKNQISPDLASLVSAPLAAGSDGGYRFSYRVAAAADSGDARYVIEAVPQDYGTSGRTSFLRDASGKIHAADRHGASATADDPAWQENRAQ